MSYRDKPIDREPFARPPQGERMWGLFALVPLFVIPVTRWLAGRGHTVAASSLLWGTIVLGALCVIGILLGYRSARSQVARDLAEMNRHG